MTLFGDTQKKKPNYLRKLKRFLPLDWKVTMLMSIILNWLVPVISFTSCKLQESDRLYDDLATSKVPSLLLMCLVNVSRNFLWNFQGIQRLPFDMQDEILRGVVHNNAEFITDTTIAPFLVSTRQRLTLHSCHMLTNNTAVNIARNCKLLRTLVWVLKRINH